MSDRLFGSSPSAADLFMPLLADAFDHVVKLKCLQGSMRPYQTLQVALLLRLTVGTDELCIELYAPFKHKHFGGTVRI